MPEKQTVLYIDHDPTSRMLVERTLRYAGYAVVSTERGIDGIDVARSQRIDLILTDIDLPDITGRELTTVLRSDTRFTKVPIVALTNLGYGEQRDLAMAAGLTGYITKPLDVEGLPMQLEYYLQGGRDKIDKERLSEARTRYSREIVTQLELRVRELEARNKDLMRIDQIKDTFLQITAHELRTPLTLVYGYSRLLQDNQSVQDALAQDPLTADLLKGLVDGIERMQNIINEILTMSRIMSDKIELSVSPVSLVGIILEVTERYRTAVEERRLDLNIEKDGFPKIIRGDSEMFHLVFDNLISNAIKYTPDGGKIVIKATTDNRSVFVRFVDTGIGIDKEEIEMVFERFHTASNPQLHSTSKTAYGGGGLGLGLAISKGIIEAHGGTITAKSPGRDIENPAGSEFIVQIPLQLQLASQARTTQL